VVLPSILYTSSSNRGKLDIVETVPEPWKSQLTRNGKCQWAGIILTFSPPIPDAAAIVQM
jgi:hypothetical protein